MIARLTQGVIPAIVLLDSLQQQAFYIGSNLVATKAKKPTSKKTAGAKTETTVTRIKATDSTKAASVKKVAKSAPKKSETKATSVSAKSALTPFIALGTYFKGAWYELRQVRWPNRKQTWGLTAAVIIFSVFFIIMIVLLDALFKYLFELILI